MALLAIDLGGTKLAAAVFTQEGKLLSEEKVLLDGRRGAEVGQLLTGQVKKFISLQKHKEEIAAVGVSVPGIYYQKQGLVWAPNIGGWNNYPLLSELQSVIGNIPVAIDSDRACYILGEQWKGNAQNCSDVIFIAVGTGIGAGILADGKILRGKSDIAGAIGWMALKPPFDRDYEKCGCFETSASGEGIARLTRKIIAAKNEYSGVLKNKSLNDLNASEIFEAYENGDAVAQEVFDHCIQFWGMAIANLVSLFNPQKIILGGGVFGPAVKLIPSIGTEAAKWAQPVSMKQVVIEASALGSKAGVYGAAYLAIQNHNNCS